MGVSQPDEVILSLNARISRGRRARFVMDCGKVKKTAARLDKRKYETMIGLYYEFLDELV